MTDPDAPSRKDPKWSEFCHWIAKVPAGGVLQVGLKEIADEKHQSTLEHKRVGKEGEIMECTLALFLFSFLSQDKKSRTEADKENRYGTRATTQDGKA